jgi:peptide-methionine (S)-S-oxide reductase
MNQENKKIIFAGGCFWCTEAVFTRLKGVLSVTSGYSGGETENPTYEQVTSGKTGHALETLLSVFFATHDPTTLNRQGNDVGTQYRSAVFYMDDGQKTEIEKFIGKISSEKIYNAPVVTEVAPYRNFYEAEQYHKDYYKNNQSQPYCQLVINPKLNKLKEKYSHLLIEQN